ncbi:MAG TPA: DUF2314 domain-containing protein [Isosphaeraceae bacterium]|jgi:uncharacterized protein YegJ (DUF2314 family)|nr:DUF2314 domain-containing protein [Isosphaeraceae bacterium]
MWLPFFRRRRARPIRLKLPDPIFMSYGVFFRADGEPPGQDDLAATSVAWAEERIGAPLGEALAEWGRRGLVTFLVTTREDGPPLPDLDFLRQFGMGDDEERRLGGATHLALVTSPDRIQHPRLGFWAAAAAARAIAERHDGVVLDPSIPRLLPVEGPDDEFPGDGRLHIPRQIVVPFSIDARGLGWMTTKGLGKFGLPELEVRDVPPDLPNVLLPLINGVAGLLVATTLAAAAERDDPPKTIEIGPEVRLDLDTIARTYRGEPEGPPEGVRGWTTIRLEFHRGRKGADDFLRLVPPAHFPEGQGVWLHSALGDLFGTAHDIRGVPGDSAAMAEAHARAVATLPDIKQRFRAGLAPGEQLLVKHGFPVGGPDDFHEFMWIAVNTWDDDRIRGQLANDPVRRVDLRAGQAIELAESDVFDWVLMRPDGATEGGFTNLVATEHDPLADEPDDDDES